MNQTSMVVRYYQINTSQIAALKPCKEFTPAEFGLAVSGHEAQGLPVPLCIDSDGDHHGSKGADTAVVTDLMNIDYEKRIFLVSQVPVVPCRHIGHSRLHSSETVNLKNSFPFTTISIKL